MDEKTHSLYAKGIYNADDSAALISKVTNAVIDQVIEWQSRPLETIHPMVYLDCIVVKIPQDKQVINKSICLALGISAFSSESINPLSARNTVVASLIVLSKSSLALPVITKSNVDAS